MSKAEKLKEKIMDPAQARNVTFAEAVAVLQREGFVWDLGSGSHQVYRHTDGRRVTPSQARIRPQAGLCAGHPRTTQTLNPMKYLVKIHWSEEDEAYVASVPALPGCVAHGDTCAEAAAMIEDAASAWLASAEKHSDPVPAPDLAAESIRSIAPLLNVSKLARAAGINVHTLSSKLRRKSRFTEEESRKILGALQEV